MAGSANIANTKVVPSATVGAPYYDDYNEDKGFYRILIRPGYPVQARELTQMQTMAQVQTERFGRSIYQNGSLVQGGQISLDTATCLNLQVQYANADVNVSQFLGSKISYGTGNTLVQAVVVGVSANNSTEPPALVVKYLTGTEFAPASTISVPNTAIFANIATSAANTPATIASINDGIFFYNGFFVRAPGQTVVVSKFTTQANAKIGLQLSDAIITESDDTSLLDPAQESSNYQAPGGARYKIALTLATRSLTSNDDSAFIELMRVENGIIKKKVNYAAYSDLEDTLARRTFDESGSYTVRPFRLNITDHPTDANSVLGILDPGKAYVYGYEYETISQTPITIPRARDTKTVGAYSLPMVYGGYLTVGDARGFVDHTEPMIMDLHCVPHQFVSNIASPATTPPGGQYRSTKIGTARVRGMIYDGASNAANAGSRTYRLYVFDTQYSNLKGNISATISSSNLQLYDPSGQNTFSSNAGAYQGATIRLTSGTGAGQYAVISGYTVNAGGFKFLTTNTAFSVLPTNQTNFAIEFDAAETRSLVSVVGSNTGASNVWTKYNVTDASRQGSGGRTQIQDFNDASLVFPFPQSFLKAGSLSSPTVPSYNYRKVFTGVQFTNGTITTPTGGIQVDGINEQFLSPSGSSSGTSSSVLANYTVFVTNPQSTGRSNGDIVQLGSISVSGGGGSTHLVQMTTDGSVASDTFVATIVATVDILAGGETGAKSKTKITGNTTVFNPASAASNGSFQTNFGDANTPINTSNATVYLQAGQVFIQSPTKTPGQKQLLYISDAIRVSKIYDLQGASAPAFGAAITGADVTNRFTFDNGQTDTHYGHSSITLKNATAPISGNLIVVVDWYDHTAGATSSGLGYFSIDSYPLSNTTSGYADVPTFKGSDGMEFSLRDCIDFRPRVQNAQNTTPGYPFQGLRLPFPNQTMDFAQYQYYLPRRDKLVLSKDRQFRLVQGVSAIDPQEPGNITDSMVLYRLYSPPYTMLTSNVEVSYVENKRYTMRDIGTLETRITNLEYYTSLSLLEKDAAEVTITDDLGLQRTKYGILVDSFSGHSIGDVTNPDYDCAMDVVEGGMTARNFATGAKLYYASNSSVKVVGQAALLTYTTEDFVTQPYATKTENVQPYMFAVFAGTLKMFPDADIWVDTLTPPAVVINPSGQNDNLVSVPPSQNGSSSRANTTPRPDPHGGRRHWWKIGHHGVSDRRINTPRTFKDR